jgi:Zn-dependent protease with chaperone function
VNYFRAQDDARRRTGRLVVLFVLAVIALIAGIYLPLAASQSSEGGIPFWNPPLLGAVSGLVVLVVGLSSLFKIAQLGKGGSAVAEMLGGTPIAPSTRDPHERQLLNVVEEMAIASGVPVPPVYLVEDDSINAFAAGYTPQNAVIGVTRGCMTQLDRAQLQGVMAHEFSHILNGDMRLNIRLTGVIFGILVIGLIGWTCLRYLGPALAHARGGRKNDGAAVGLGIMAFGLLLWAAGSLGTLFGRLIQAAVSRQREYLADASAVQFTRNPAGIAGALRKIGGLPPKQPWNPHVSEFGHFFFTAAFAAAFATHPPIRERVARIEGIDAASIEGSSARPASTSPAGASGLAGVEKPTRTIPRREVERSLARIGGPDPELVRRAASIATAVPPLVADACREPMDARGVIVGLLLSADRGIRDAQEHALAGDAALLASVRGLAPAIAPMRRAAMLAAIDLAVPALSELSAEQYRAFRDRVTAVMLADRKVDLFEWVVRTVLERHVEARFVPRARPAPRERIDRRGPDVQQVLATLAWSGHRDASDARGAFAAAIASLGWSGAALPQRERCTLDALDASLRRLSALRLEDRRLLLEACVESIAHDGATTEIEAQLLRAIGDALDCPIPPIAA